MKTLNTVSQSAPSEYGGESIQDAESNQLIIGANGVVFKCGGHEVVLPCTPPRNYGELESCIESLQSKARQERADGGLQKALATWWEKLTG